MITDTKRSTDASTNQTESASPSNSFPVPPPSFAEAQLQSQPQFQPQPQLEPQPQDHSQFEPHSPGPQPPSNSTTSYPTNQQPPGYFDAAGYQNSVNELQGALNTYASSKHNTSRTLRREMATNIESTMRGLATRPPDPAVRQDWETKATMFAVDASRDENVSLKRAIGMTVKGLVVICVLPIRIAGGALMVTGGVVHGAANVIHGTGQALYRAGQVRRSQT